MAIALSLREEEGGNMDLQKRKLNDSYQTNFQMANRKEGSLSKMKMMRRRCWRLPLPCQWKSTSDRSTSL